MNSARADFPSNRNRKKKSKARETLRRTRDHRALVWLASSPAAFQPPVHLQTSVTESTEVSGMQREHLPTFWSLHAPSASRGPVWRAWGAAASFGGARLPGAGGVAPRQAQLCCTVLKWGELNHSPVLLREPWKVAAGWQRRKGALRLPSLRLGYRSTNTEKAAHLLGRGESCSYSGGEGNWSIREIGCEFLRN